MLPTLIKVWIQKQKIQPQNTYKDHILALHPLPFDLSFVPDLPLFCAQVVEPQQKLFCDAADNNTGNK